MKSPANCTSAKLTSASEVSFNPFRCDVCDGGGGEAEAGGGADEDEDFYCRSSDCNQCASEYYDESRNENAGFAADRHYRKLSKKRRSCSLSNLVDDDLPDIFQDSSHTNTTGGGGGGGLYYSNSSRYTRPEDRRFNIENSYYETLRETEYLHEYKSELRDLQAIGYCEWVNFHLDRIKPEDLVKLNKFYTAQAAAAAAAADSEDTNSSYAAPVFRASAAAVSKRKDQQLRMYLFVSDLSADLSDGIRLLHLIEVLYNCKLQKEFGKMKLHKLRNMATCLEYLVDNRKLKCFGINLADLVNGNLDIMLGLLFHIRRDYESAKFAIERAYKLKKVKSFFQNYETNKQMALLERREKKRVVRNRLYFKSPLTLSLIKQAPPKRKENDNTFTDDHDQSLAPQRSSSSRSSLCSHCPHRKKFNLPAIKVENLSDDETDQPLVLEVSQHLDDHEQQVKTNVYESIENLLENSIQRLNHLKEANEIILQKLEESNKNLENSSNSNELDDEDSRLTGGGDSSQLDETLNDVEDEPSFNSDMGNLEEHGSFERQLESSLSSANEVENIPIECNVEVEEESNLEVEEIEIKASKTSADLNAMVVPRTCGDSFEQVQSARDSIDDTQSSSYQEESSISPSSSVATTTSITEPSPPEPAPRTEILVDYETAPPRIIILEQLSYTETTQGELNFAKTKTLRKNKPGIKTIDENAEELSEPSEVPRTSTEQTTTTSEEAFFNTVISNSKARNKKKRRKNAKRTTLETTSSDQDYCDEVNGERETSVDISSEIVQEVTSSSTEHSCEGETRDTVSSLGDSSQFDVPDTPNVSRATETDESLSLTRPPVIPLDWPQKAESDATDKTAVVEVEVPVETIAASSQEPVCVPLETKEEDRAGSSQSQRRNRKKRASNYYDKIIELADQVRAETPLDRPSSTLTEVSSAMTSMSLRNEPSSSSLSENLLTSTPRESESQPVMVVVVSEAANDQQSTEQCDEAEETEIKVGTTKIVIVEKSVPSTPTSEEPAIASGGQVAKQVEPEPVVQQPSPVSLPNDEVQTPVEAAARPTATLNDFIVKPNRKSNKSRAGKNKKPKNDDELRSKDGSPPLPPDSLSSSNSLLSLSHDPGSYQRSKEDVNEDTDTNNNNFKAPPPTRLLMESKETMTSESMVISDARLTESLTLDHLEVDNKSLNGLESHSDLQASNLDSFSSSMASYSSMTSASSSSMSEDQMFQATRKPAEKIAQSLSSSPEPASSSVSSLSSGSSVGHQPLSNGTSANLRPRNVHEHTKSRENSKKKPFSQTNGAKENREYVSPAPVIHLNGGVEKASPTVGVVGRVSEPVEVGSRNEKARRKEPARVPDFQIPIIKVQDEEVTIAKQPVAAVKAKPKPQINAKSSSKTNGSPAAPSQQLRKSSKPAIQAKPTSTSCIKKTLLIFLVTMFVLFSALVTLFYLTFNEGSSSSNFNIGDLLTMTKRYLSN